MSDDSSMTLSDVLRFAKQVKEQCDKQAETIQKLQEAVNSLQKQVSGLTESHSSVPAAAQLPPSKVQKLSQGEANASGKGIVLQVLPNYSDKAMVVFGKEACMLLKDKFLKPNNFKFGQSFRCGPGWMIPRSKMTVDQLRAMLAKDPDGSKVTLVVAQESNAPAAAGGGGGLQDSAGSVGEKRKASDEDA